MPDRTDKELKDELRPSGNARPVPQRSEGGDEKDTAGEHGPMAPETAERIQDVLEGKKKR